MNTIKLALLFLLGFAFIPYHRHKSSTSKCASKA